MHTVDESLVQSPDAILRKLLEYCRKNDWKGYDPYDALNSRIFEVLPFLDYRIPRLALTQFLKRSPVNLRPMLFVPKTENPKAIALFLMTLLKLASLGQGVVDADLISVMIEKLTGSRSKGSSYWCWGYNFPWQTRAKLVPRGAPNLVCTVFVADALLDAYAFSHDLRYLGMAVGAAEYLVNDLFWTGEDDLACFAYPLPSSRSPVHNANFLAAGLLCRIDKYRGESGFRETALRAARYSTAMQHKDGSWNYGEAAKQRWVDNFHTGYNLCALRSIAKNAGVSEFDSNIHRGFKFYRDHFFGPGSAPKYFHDRAYPIDIHSVAQSMITLLEFEDLDEGGFRLACSVYEWAMRNMWDERGYFRYQITSLYRNNIPYMRWSQAWMLFAISILLEHRSRRVTGNRGKVMEYEECPVTVR